MDSSYIERTNRWKEAELKFFRILHAVYLENPSIKNTFFFDKLKIQRGINRVPPMYIGTTKRDEKQSGITKARDSTLSPIGRKITPTNNQLPQNEEASETPNLSCIYNTVHHKPSPLPQCILGQNTPRSCWTWKESHFTRNPQLPCTPPWIGRWHLTSKAYVKRLNSKHAWIF